MTLMTDRRDDGGRRTRLRPIPAERAIRWSAVAVVVLLAAGAAVVSYRHAYELVLAHGETGPTAAITPATVDGMIYASSMVILASARSGRTWLESLRSSWLAYVGLVLGIAATIGANVAHGLEHGPIGAIVAAWPAVALVISYETLMLIVRAGRRSQPAPADAEPCQCGERGEQVALTLPEALAIVVESGTSQRKIADALSADRKKLSAIIRQAESPADQVAEIEPAQIPEPA